MGSRTIYYRNMSKTNEGEILKSTIRDVPNGIILGFQNLYRLTERNVPLVYESFLAHVPPSGNVVFDLSGIESIDSRGLAFLITLHDRFDSEGRSFALLGLCPAVQRVFRMTQISELIPVYQTEDFPENDVREKRPLDSHNELDILYADLNFVQQVEGGY